MLKVTVFVVFHGNSTSSGECQFVLSHLEMVEELIVLCATVNYVGDLVEGRRQFIVVKTVCKVLV